MPNRPIILPVIKKDIEPTIAISSIPSIHEKRAHNNINFRRQRRKRKSDRRNDVRNGVIVSLSFENDRRKNQDRRRP